MWKSVRGCRGAGGVPELICSKHEVRSKDKWRNGVRKHGTPKDPACLQAGYAQKKNILRGFYVWNCWLCGK